MKNMIHDIRHEIQHINASRSALRNFAFVLGLLLLSMGILSWYRDRPLWFAFVAGGLLLSALAFVKPHWIRPVYFVAAGIAAVIGYFLSRLILFVVFAFVLTPIALLVRLFGKDPMQRRLDPKAGTYWITREKKTKTLEEYERLF